MYVERQGTNFAPKIKELETRLEMLENVVKALQLEKPKMGRPPKDKHGTERIVVDNSSGN